eukprot:Lithocolla_globosa_v1_NODE_4642_length_1395_cov_12.945522.p2 type:complete len:121 gc:universal NODE_4642_length_1395_cov_12.945522:309-671(+)
MNSTRSAFYKEKLLTSPPSVYQVSSSRLEKESTLIFPPTLTAAYVWLCGPQPPNMKAIASPSLPVRMSLPRTRVRVVVASPSVMAVTRPPPSVFLPEMSLSRFFSHLVSLVIIGPRPQAT